MSGRNRIHQALASSGAVGFAGVVSLLTALQPGYDPIHQFMSELAQGRLGELMIVAFVALAVAIAAAVAQLRIQGAPKVLTRPLALAAALCLVAVGAITLEVSVQIHVLLVAAAFILCGLSMYLLPRSTRGFSHPLAYLLSWGACLAMCAATVLGGQVLPVGLAQRISAGTLVFWLLWVTWRRPR